MSEEKKKAEEMLPIPINSGELAPKDGQQLWYLSKVFAATDMVGKDFKRKPQNTFVALAMGMELGISHMQALQNIAVVHGKPTVYGDLTIALVQGSGQLEDMEEYWDCVSGWGEEHKEYFEGEDSLADWPDDLTAVCKMKRKGIKKPFVGRFSVGDAKRIGKWNRKTSNDNATTWMKSPKDMLMWRARHRAEKGFADILKGIIPSEVAEDYGDGAVDLEKTNGHYEMPSEQPDPPTDSPQLEEFNKRTKPIREMMDEFVGLCASNSGMSDDQVKLQVMETDYDAFLAKFKEWVAATKGPESEGDVVDAEFHDVAQSDNTEETGNDEADDGDPMGLDDKEEDPFQDPPPPEIDEDGYSKDLEPEKKKEIQDKKPAKAKKPAPAKAKKAPEKKEESSDRVSIDSLKMALKASTKKTLGALIVSEQTAMLALKFQDAEFYTEIFRKFRKYYPSEPWPLQQQQTLFSDNPESASKVDRLKKYFPDYLAKAQEALKITLTRGSDPKAVELIEKKIIEMIDKERHPKR